MPFGYDCIICRERYPSQSERNEHLETHFVHKKCTDCDRLVILIGDLEFELHRPIHCKNVGQIGIIDNTNMQPFVALERLKNEVVADNDALTEDDYKILVEEKNEMSKSSNTDSENCTLSIADDISLNPESNQLPEQSKPKASIRKRSRKKSVKKSDKDTEKKSPRSVKSRPIKIIQCTQEGCTEEFRQQQLLRKHLKTAHGIVEKHLCSICNFAFSDKSNLKHHMVTHTDNKRFICSFCGARFHKLTNMTEHMNAHLGLKPYKCELCGKDFGRSNHKRQHMRVFIENNIALQNHYNQNALFIQIDSYWRKTIYLSNKRLYTSLYV